jgi:hypothetical protein
MCPGAGPRENVPGVVLIRFPGNARSQLCKEMMVLVEGHGIELKKCFTVLEPGWARLRKI